MVKYAVKTYWRIHWLISVPYAPVTQAEWLAAQMDERAMADLEDEDEEGVSFSQNQLIDLFKAVFCSGVTHHVSIFCVTGHW